MYAVIFKAHLRQLDDEYFDTAARMRELAKQDYGCVEFTSVQEDGLEITISYWQRESDILRWKQDPEHQRAQQLGRTRWYASYRVEVVEIKRHYGQDGLTQE